MESQVRYIMQVVGKEKKHSKGTGGAGGKQAHSILWLAVIGRWAGGTTLRVIKDVSSSQVCMRG